MEFNASVAAGRMAEVAGAMGLRTGLMTPPEAADAAIQTVRAFAGKAGLPTTLREIGIQYAQFDQVARGALRDAYIVTNPRPVSEADVRAICQAAW
jgi:alcohol dehydrogenase